MCMYIQSPLETAADKFTVGETSDWECSAKRSTVKKRPAQSGRGHVEESVHVESKFTRTAHGPADCALPSGSIDLGRLYITATERQSARTYTRPLPRYAQPNYYAVAEYPEDPREIVRNYRFSEFRQTFHPSSFLPSRSDNQSLVSASKLHACE